jgi:hypothetical protein
MLKKHGKFMADWRDERAQRKRKAFTTKTAALRHQTKMRAQAQAKKAHGSGPRGKSSKPTRKHSRRATSAATPRKNSRGSSDTSNRTK